MIRRAMSAIADTMVDDFFTAGQRVSPGRYQLVGTKRDIYLDREDVLPASLDGRVAVYVRYPMTWADLHKNKRDERRPV